MNSVFTSFDALFAEYMSQKLRATFFRSAPKGGGDNGNSSSSTGGSVKSQHDGVVKKATDDVNKKQQPQKTLRLALELDGLHGFETLVSY